MALHFSSERPDDQFYTDFGNFNKFEEEVRRVLYELDMYHSNSTGSLPVSSSFSRSISSVPSCSVFSCLPSRYVFHPTNPSNIIHCSTHLSHPSCWANWKSLPLNFLLVSPLSRTWSNQFSSYPIHQALYSISNVILHLGKWYLYSQK